MDGQYHNLYPDFKWLADNETEELEVMMVPDDSSRRYLLECDLGKYYFYYLYTYVYFIKCNVSFLCVSEYLRDFISVMFLSYVFQNDYPHKDYKLAPERHQIGEHILRDYQHHLLQDKGFSEPPLRLVSNLLNKTNYIIHYRNLKLHLELGLPLTDIHLVLFFN